MKNLLLKFRIIAVMAIAMGILTACPGPDPVDPVIPGNTETLKISLKEAGPGYVDLTVETGSELEAAYTVGTTKRTISNPAILFSSGKKVTLVPNETLRISADIQETTTYYLYIAAKLNADTYSEIFEIEFTTPEFEFSNLLTVVGVDYDGFKMQVTVPKSVRTGGNAIRYSHCDLMMYNYGTKFYGNDDYFNLLYNGGAYLQENKVLEYLEENNWRYADADVNDDGVVDENDVEMIWDPMSPGQPVVFIAGEFEWMEIPEDWNSEDNYEVNGFYFPAGWQPGYYVPCIDPVGYWEHYGVPYTKSMNLIEADVRNDIDQYWTGAFQRKIFHINKPDHLDAEVTIEAVDVSAVDATIIITPDENVKQFVYGILDDATYNQMLELCDGKEEYIQWAITSYFSFYTFGTSFGRGTTELRLDGDIFYEGMVPANSNIHVLVTAMGDERGTTQNFQHYTFQTLEKVKEAPVIEVTALEEESSAFYAAFNIKCTTADDPTRGPVTKCYYGANYKKDFILAANGGSSYFSLAQSQPFSAEEVAKINSPEGYTIKIPTIDGETTRIAVAGFNDENTPNDFNYKDITECPAVADITTPYRDAKPYIKSDLFKTLKGDWTATAKLSDGTTHSSKMTISSGITEGEHYPAALPDSVYTIYSEEVGMSREQVNGCFDRFKTAAEEYNTYRLEYQNCLLMEGWIDKDEYDRLHYYNPFDLFVSRTYSGVDEKSMFSDFGPKLYLEVSEGDKLSITSNASFMPPTAYTSVPYYLALYTPERTVEEGNFAYYDYDKIENAATPGEEAYSITFPVELSADGNTLTIKPHVDKDGVKWYPNMIAYDATSYSYVAGPMVVSEVTITRGWTETKSSVSSKTAARTRLSANDAPSFSHKSLTRFKAPEEKTIVNATLTTSKLVEERFGYINKALEKRIQNK